MSVPDQTPYIIHTANGLTTVFAFEFYIIANSDLRVAVNGTDVTSGFTVSGAGNTHGGEITFNSPPLSGSEILIERKISALRLTEYQNNGDFLAETVNKDFDRIWMSNKRSEIYLDLALQRPLTGGEFDANGFQIKNLEKPVDAKDASTKGYADDLYVEFTGKADQLNDAFTNGMYGYITIDSFQKGAVLTLRNQVLKDERTGEYYRWDGDWSKAKAVPANSTPENTGGISDGGWVGVGDAAFRTQLAGDNGSDFIYYKPSNISQAVKISLSQVLDDHINVKNFGAIGNWNAELQTGNDDSEAFRNYAAFINTLINPRSGGARIMRVPAGNFRIRGFNIGQGEAYWSFNIKGEGQLTQLWMDPTGEGIILGNENSVISDITINGKLTPGYPSISDPAIPYIVKAKLDNKLLDVDLICNNVNILNYNCFARIAGRGFTFNGGGAGMGGDGGLCEIACDADLIVTGDTPSIHGLQSAMRHFKIDNARFDVNSSIFIITGTHAVKEYINGVTISSCELSNCTCLVKSTDCRLVSPVFNGNKAIGSFRSSGSSGAVDVPRAVDVKDEDNSWSNYTNPGEIIDSRDKGISYIHRYDSIDGFNMSGTTAKGLVFGVLRADTYCNGVNINGNHFPNFGDVSAVATLVESVVTPTNLKINGNTLTSKTVKSRKWISQNNVNSRSIQIGGNICDESFPVQGLIYTPSIPGADGTWSNYGVYRVSGDEVTVDFILTSSDSVKNSGDIRVSLPVPPKVLNVNVSGRFSGAGCLSQLTGFLNTTGGHVVTPVPDATDGAIRLIRWVNLVHSNLSFTDRSSGTISISGSVTYKI